MIITSALLDALKVTIFNQIGGFMKKLFVLVVIVSVVFSCTQRFTQIPKLNIVGQSIDGESFSIKDYKMVDKNVTSTDMYPIILFIPIIGNNQELIYGLIDNAVQDICSKNNFAFITNVKIYAISWYIPLLYGQVEIKIVGEGWSKNERAAIQKELQGLSFNTLQ